MRERIDPRTVTLARNYLTRPEELWQDAAHRQVRKLKVMLRRSARPGERAAEVIEEALALARLRTCYAPPPIYLTNIGSSGSHWLEAMLARATDVHNCGEVYLPDALWARLAQAPAADVAFFLHAVYALHSLKLGPALMSGRFVNSAHLARLSGVADLTPGALRILLVRHPVEVVVSRTFRKAEYRADVGADMDDAAYLERNCDVVERFYRAARDEPFDARVRYEDLIAEPRATLATLIDALGLASSADAVEQAVAATSPDAVRGARERGERAPTNLFLDEPAPVDESLRARARARLRACCEQLGYAA